MKKYSSIFTYVQFLVILWYIIYSDLMTHGIWLYIEAAGILITIWALIAMGMTTFSVFPTPVTKGRFTRRGPYRLIRHPMYTGLIMVAVALTFSDYNDSELIALMVLCVDMVLKVTVEERLLVERYPEYEEYKKGTFRVVPFLW